MTIDYMLAIARNMKLNEYEGINSFADFFLVFVVLFDRDFLQSFIVAHPCAENIAATH